MLWISTRRRGRSLGQMARDELGAIGGAAALVGVLVIMVIIIAVLALVVVTRLAESPWGVFSIAMTIPIALFMGCYLRFLRPGRVAEVSLIGFALLMLAVVSGDWVGETAWGASWLNLSPVTRVVAASSSTVRRVGAAGVAAARAARLPVDVHEGRRHRPAGDRYLHRPPGDAGAGGLAVRRSAATGRCSPARCSRSCSSPSRAARCPDFTR